MRRTIAQMALILEKNNIIVPVGARKVDHREETEEHDETCHALKASCSRKHTFLIDLGASNHMVASIESFSSLQCTHGSSIHMGDDNKI